MAVYLLFVVSLVFAAGQPLQAQSPGVISQFPSTPNGPQARTRAELDAFGRVMEAKQTASIIAASEAFARRYPQSQLLTMVRLREMRAEIDVNSYEGAVSIGHELLAGNPRNLEALLLMANVLPDFPTHDAARRKSILAEARKDLESVRRLLETLHIAQGASPGEFIANKNRLRISLAEAAGFIDLVAGQNQDAIQQYKWALAHGADPSPVTALRLGRAYLHAGDLENARAHLRQATQSSSTVIRQKAEELLKNAEAASGGHE